MSKQMTELTFVQKNKQKVKRQSDLYYFSSACLRFPLNIISETSISQHTISQLISNKMHIIPPKPMSSLLKFTVKYTLLIVLFINITIFYHLSSVGLN